MQTARRAIAHGDIGVPMSAQTVMQYPGPDIFHPNPEFLREGSCPLFDMGPYYITTLVHISDRSPQLRQWGQRIAPPAPSRSEIGWEPSSRLTSPPTCRPSRSSPVEG